MRGYALRNATIRSAAHASAPGEPGGSALPRGQGTDVAFALGALLRPRLTDGRKSRTWYRERDDLERPASAFAWSCPRYRSRRRCEIPLEPPGLRPDGSNKVDHTSRAGPSNPSTRSN